MAEDFASFLNPKQMPNVSGNRGAGHDKYGRMLGRGVVFPHHEPKNRDREFFQRAVERFGRVLHLPGRKLLVLAHPVTSMVEARAVHSPDGAGCGVAEVKRLFEDLRGKRAVKDFEFVVIYMMLDGASEIGGRKPGAEPKVRPLLDTGPGEERMVVLELHCVGHCTGLKFKAEADEQALRRLLVGKEGRGVKRRFDLQPDPMPVRLERSRGLKRLLGDVIPGDFAGDSAALAVRRKPSAAVKVKEEP